MTLSEADPAKGNRSQIVTGSQKHRDPRFLPYAFTEHGALMAANVLRSSRAIQMSVLIVQTFVRLRQMAVSMDALARKVAELERATQENRGQIKDIVAAIRQLMTPEERPPREIGFHTRLEKDQSQLKLKNQLDQPSRNDCIQADEPGGDLKNAREDPNAPEVSSCANCPRSNSTLPLSME